jgi:hypothetical protein
MRRTLYVLAMLGALGARAGAEVKKDAAADRELDKDTVLGSPVTHENLTLIPVIAKKGVKEPKEYLVLDEGFDRKVVKVKEKDSERVNELTLVNDSDQPLFVMAGEVILGGKQDRIIGKDTIIPAKQTVAVPVFCVEHGRWTEEDGRREFRSGKALAHTKLRNNANYDDQSKVWQEVDAKNKKRKVDNTTQTYRKVATDKSVETTIKPYADHFRAALSKVEGADRMVGFVVVVNGQIVGMEQFASPKLFKKLQDKMLRSYYVEAVDVPLDKEAVKKPVAADDVRTFNKRAEEAEKKAVIERKKEKIRTLQMKDGDVSGSEVVDEEYAPAETPVYKSKYMH